MHECCKKECKHENVKFCPKCLKPYCVDCGKEWEEKCTLNHFFPWYVYPTATTPYPYIGTTWTQTENIAYTCQH